MAFVKQLYLIAWLTITALTITGCSPFYSAASNSEVKPAVKDQANSGTKENKFMKIKLGEVSFDLPNGFPAPRNYQEPNQDSGYEKGSQFSSGETDGQAKTVHESLEVGWEFESSESLEQIVSEVKEKMQSAGGYKIEREKEMTVDGQPAILLLGSAEEKNEPKIYVYVIHIKSADGKFLRINYNTERNAAEADAVFTRLTESATFNSNGGKPKTPTPEGCQRYDSGDISLDVPTNLTPNRSQKVTSLRIEQFPEQSWNVEQIVYTMEYFDKENISLKSDMTDEVLKFQDANAVAARESDSFDTGQLKGKLNKLILTVPTMENAEGKTAVSLAEGKTKDGTIVQLKGDSPFSKREEMEIGFREILNSIKTETPHEK